MDGLRGRQIKHMSTKSKRAHIHTHWPQSLTVPEQAEAETPRLPPGPCHRAARCPSWPPSAPPSGRRPSSQTVTFHILHSVNQIHIQSHFTMGRGSPGGGAEDFFEASDIPSACEGVGLCAQRPTHYKVGGGGLRAMRRGHTTT